MEEKDEFAEANKKTVALKPDSHESSMFNKVWFFVVGCVTALLPAYGVDFLDPFALGSIVAAAVIAGVLLGISYAHGALQIHVGLAKEKELVAKNEAKMMMSEGEKNRGRQLMGAEKKAHLEKIVESIRASQKSVLGRKSASFALVWVNALFLTAHVFFAFFFFQRLKQPVGHFASTAVAGMVTFLVSLASKAKLQ